LNNKIYLKKFDAEAQKCIFLGYTGISKAYKMYNFETNTLEEQIHIKVAKNKMSELVESFYRNTCF